MTSADRDSISVGPLVAGACAAPTMVEPPPAQGGCGRRGLVQPRRFALLCAFATTERSGAASSRPLLSRP